MEGPFQPEPVEEPTEVEWFAERLWPWEGQSRVGQWIPEGFERYARIAHEGWFRRSAVAKLAVILAEATTSPDASWYAVWDGYGGLEAIRRRAVEISPRLSASGRRYLLFRVPVQGAKDFGIDSFVHPLVRHRWWMRYVPARFWQPTERRPVFHPPSFWWPEDRAWFLSNEIDAESAYVGGPRSLVDRLRADPHLEVFPASLEDPLDVFRPTEAP